jgi:hypothetical protein
MSWDGLAAAVTGEEAEQHGARDGMVRAVSATGGVITSAGIVLAAVLWPAGAIQTKSADPQKDSAQHEWSAP